MHTSLIKKISEEVNELCKMNQYKKLTKLVLTVNYDSDISEDKLRKRLQHTDKKKFGKWTQIQITKDNIHNQTAILRVIEGEKSD